MGNLHIDVIGGFVSVNLDTVTLSEALGIIANMSVDVGTELPADAVTVLYSGKVAGFSFDEIADSLYGVRRMQI